MNGRSGIANTIFVLALVIGIFTLLSVAFAYLNTQSTVVANDIAPGSLSTADYYIFSQLSTFFAGIVAISAILLAIRLAKGGN